MVLVLYLFLHASTEGKKHWIRWIKYVFLERAPDTVSNPMFIDASSFSVEVVHGSMLMVFDLIKQ